MYLQGGKNEVHLTIVLFKIFQHFLKVILLTVLLLIK